MMSRLCHLIELRNAPCRARNNAYLRGHRAYLRIKEMKKYSNKNCVEIDFKQLEKLEAKKLKSKLEYHIAYAEASKVIKEVSKEISKLKKELKIRKLQRMSMCPIIQNIYMFDSNGDVICLNGKRIREQAMYYAIDEILLKE
ncbi:hypothetical protein UFOVP53_195 [uncultured Caudovirales phage]|uniref:Uncharacterized protein n=1 Tax=uncultured Caudovirales phage TaxID=2100421 RepID=A0A6J5KX70_9CAUD|nr:hypothetical protein UFOVP53_195 [uncultured Caudovirales phage]